MTHPREAGRWPPPRPESASRPPADGACASAPQSRWSPPPQGSRTRRQKTHTARCAPSSRQTCWRRWSSQRWCPPTEYQLPATCTAWWIGSLRSTLSTGDQSDRRCRMQKRGGPCRIWWCPWRARWRAGTARSWSSRRKTGSWWWGWKRQRSSSWRRSRTLPSVFGRTHPCLPSPPIPQFRSQQQSHKGSADGCTGSQCWPCRSDAMVTFLVIQSPWHLWSRRLWTERLRASLDHQCLRLCCLWCPDPHHCKRFGRSPRCPCCWPCPAATCCRCEETWSGDCLLSFPSPPPLPLPYPGGG